MKDLYGYDMLIERFLNREISASQFEDAYLNKYLGDIDPISDELYEPLEWLFAEVDAFSHDPKTFPDDYINEDRLRESAAKILQQIRSLK